MEGFIGSNHAWAPIIVRLLAPCLSISPDQVIGDDLLATDRIESSPDRLCSSIFDHGTATSPNRVDHPN